MSESTGDLVPGFFTKVIQSGVPVDTVPGDISYIPYKNFFPSDKDNIYLATRGWITKEDHSEKNTVIPFHPDNLPKPLQYIPIEGHSLNGSLLKKYFIYYPDACDVQEISHVKDVESGKSSQNTASDDLVRQGYKLVSESEAQIYVKTKPHAVQINGQLLANPELRSLVNDLLDISPMQK